MRLSCLLQTNARTSVAQIILMVIAGVMRHGTQHTEPGCVWGYQAAGHSGCPCWPEALVLHLAAMEKRAPVQMNTIFCSIMGTASIWQCFGLTSPTHSYVTPYAHEVGLNVLAHNCLRFFTYSAHETPERAHCEISQKPGAGRMVRALAGFHLVSRRICGCCSHRNTDRRCWRMEEVQTQSQIDFHSLGGYFDKAKHCASHINYIT